MYLGVIRSLESPECDTKTDVTTGQEVEGHKLSQGKLRTECRHLSHLIGTLSITQAYLECATVCFRAVSGMSLQC